MSSTKFGDGGSIQYRDDDGELADLLKEGYIVERPYSQAFCLIMAAPDWRKQSGSTEQPYYKPLQNFEDGLRRAGLVPQSPNPNMGTEPHIFRAELNQKITPTGMKKTRRSRILW